MNKSRRLLNLFESVLGKSMTSGNEATFSCPYCNHHKKKLVINVITQKWHCWVCGVKGVGAERIFKKIGAAGKIKELHSLTGVKRKTDDSKDIQHVALPLEFKPMVNGSVNNPEFRNAAKYLKSRGITKTDVLRYNIGFCDSGQYNGMVIIPSYNKEGILNYFVGRSYYDTDFKHKNPKTSKDVVGFEMLINWKEDINICEGVFDAIAIGENSIPIFGKFLPKSLRSTIKENDVKRVNILLDSDAKNESIKLCEYLQSENIDVRIIEMKDDEDPSTLGHEKITKLISKSKTVDFAKLLEMKFGL
jgi:DNA primase